MWPCLVRFSEVEMGMNLWSVLSMLKQVWHIQSLGLLLELIPDRVPSRFNLLKRRVLTDPANARCQVV